MNICFILGRIISDVEFKFIYGNNKNVSIVIFDLVLQNQSIIKIEGYNEIADFVYRNINKNDIVLIKGSIIENVIQICNIEKIRV